MAETQQEEATGLVNAASFITNSSRVLECNVPSPSHANTIASLIFAGEIEQLMLEKVLCGRPALRICEAVAASCTIRSFSFEPKISYIYTVSAGERKLFVEMLAAAIANHGSLREVTVTDLPLLAEDAKALSQSLSSSSLEAITVRFVPPAPKVISALRTAKNLRSIAMEWDSAPRKQPALLSSLADWPRLDRLVLCWLGIDAAGGKALASGELWLAGIRALNLDGNKLGDEGVKEVVDGLLLDKFGGKRREVALRELDLAENSIYSEGGEAIAELVRHSPHLERLRISHNHIGDASGTALGESLRTCRHTLRWIDVDSCELGSQSIASICRSLSGAKVLSQISMSNNQAGTEGVKALTQDLLLRSRAMETLLVDENGLSAVHAESLAAGLRGSRGALRLLNLCRNKGIATAELIAALPTSLEELWLADCGVGDEEARAIVEFLRRSRCIRKLCLSRNVLHSDSAKALAEAAAPSRSLEELYLSDNVLGEQGAIAIAAELVRGKCRGLRELSIMRIGMGKKGVEIIAQAAVEAKENFIGRLSTLKSIATSAVDGGVAGRNAIKCASLILGSALHLLCYE